MVILEKGKIPDAFRHSEEKEKNHNLVRQLLKDLSLSRTGEMQGICSGFWNHGTELSYLMTCEIQKNNMKKCEINIKGLILPFDSELSMTFSYWKSSSYCVCPRNVEGKTGKTPLAVHISTKGDGFLFRNCCKCLYLILLCKKSGIGL